MEFYGTTDIGNYRSNNEDYYYTNRDLFVVADGMGGHQAGEIASKLATETFIEKFKNFLEADKSDKKIKDYLKSAIEEANFKVVRDSISNVEHMGMGTTLTACYLKEDTAYIGHIGDTRLYLKRNGKLKLETEDHTVVWELYKSGKISYEETFSHPQNNILTNVIGSNGKIRVDVFEMEIKEGDIIILCSDGLNSMLQDKLINKLIDNKKTAEQICNKLVSSAKNRGGHDNITVIVIKI